MKKALFAFTAALMLLSSCHTEEKVVYLQDIQNGEAIPTQTVTPLTLVPGDKISVIVTSGSTPQLAQQFNIQPVTGSSSNYEQYLYTIDENGSIDIPTLGRVSIGGLTRSEASEKIKTTLRDGQLRDAVVTISAQNQFVTVLGEVKSPGRLPISRDNITIFEALGQAGDLTIQARRDRIKVIRNEGGSSKAYFVDLRSKDIFNSPVYNLRQNDVVVVEPNKVRIGQSTNNDNSVRQISTWLSISSVLISLGILIFR